jgi:UDP-glucuronate 4-epimerase
MKVLVTGCAGLIGSKVSERLVRAGHSVVGVDNLSNAYDIRLKDWRLSRLLGSSGITFIRLDITDRTALDDLAQRYSFDAVVNLAARAGVRQSIEDPYAYYDTNVTGTLNLLELCHRADIMKFVLASTSSVYGHGPRPFREDQPTDRPLSPYAASKKAAEILCFTYHQLFSLDVTVLRYFTVYGPAGRPDMSIFRFVRWLVEDTPLVLYGDGAQKRDFTYVDDVAEGTVKALVPLGYEIINLGVDRPVSILEVIKVLEELVGWRARLERRASHPADATATWADIDKAKRLLGWCPTTPLHAGLSACVEWYRENRSWASQVLLGE